MTRDLAVPHRHRAEGAGRDQVGDRPQGNRSRPTDRMTGARKVTVDRRGHRVRSRIIRNRRIHHMTSSRIMGNRMAMVSMARDHGRPHEISAGDQAAASMGQPIHTLAEGRRMASKVVAWGI